MIVHKAMIESSLDGTATDPKASWRLDNYKHIVSAIPPFGALGTEFMTALLAVVAERNPDKIDNAINAFQEAIKIKRASGHACNKVSERLEKLRLDYRGNL